MSTTLKQLQRLKELFGCGEQFGDNGHDLNLPEFIQALESSRSNTLNNSNGLTPTSIQQNNNAFKEQELQQLFRRIDANSDNSVDWNEFTNYLLLEEQGAHNLEVEEARCEITPQNFVEPRQNSGHHHREIIHTIIKLDKKQAYLTASGDGEIKLWELKNLAYRRTVDHQQRITCVVYMPRPAKLVVGSVDRTLTFYEMSSFHPVGKFSNLQSVPQSLNTFDESLAYGKSGCDILLWADDGGQMHGVRIHPFRTFHVSNFDYNVSNEAIRKAHRLAEKKSKMWHPSRKNQLRNKESASLSSSADNESSSKASSSSSSSSSSSPSSSSSLFATVAANLKVIIGHGVHHVFSALLHKDWITKVKYIQPLNIVVTSSLDGTLIFFDLSRNINTKTCVAPCKKSIHDFIYCPGVTTKFIASSSKLSRDIYLWNPHSASLHTALSGHTAPIQSLCWDDTSGHLISLDKDKNIKAWDLSTYRVAQTVIDLTLYRPTNMLGSIIHDHGTESRGGTRPPRLVTASNRLCVWPIKKNTLDRSGYSHTSPISGVVYSNEFKQVISGDNDGTIQIWNIMNGEKEFKFNHTHGINHKLTNICLDPSGRRVVTCGDDGLAKIWNFSNGQCLRTCTTFSNKELSAVEFVVAGPNVFLLSGGWEKRMFVYPDVHDKPEQQYTRCIPPLDVSDIKYMNRNNSNNPTLHNHHYARIQESHKRLTQHKHHLMAQLQKKETSDVNVKLVQKRKEISTKTGFGTGATAVRPNSAAAIRRKRLDDYNVSRKNLRSGRNKRPLSAAVIRSSTVRRQHPLEKSRQQDKQQESRPATCNGLRSSFQAAVPSRPSSRPATSIGTRQKRSQSRVHFAAKLSDINKDEEKIEMERSQVSTRQRPSTAGAGSRKRSSQQRKKWLLRGKNGGEINSLPVHGARPSSAAPAAPGIRRTRYHSDRAYLPQRRPTMVSDTIKNSMNPTPSLSSVASSRFSTDGGTLEMSRKTSNVSNQFQNNNPDNRNNPQKDREDITQIPRQLSTSTSSQISLNSSNNARNNFGISKRFKTRLHGHTDDITVIRYCKGCGTVVTGSHDGYIIFWNLETGNQRFRLCTYDENDDNNDGNNTEIRSSRSSDSSRVKSVLSLTSVDICSNVSLLISSGMSNVIKLWDVRNGILLSSFKTNHNSNEWISSVAYHKSPPLTYSEKDYDESRMDIIVTGSTDGTIRVWDFKHDILQTSLSSSPAHASSFSTSVTIESNYKSTAEPTAGYSTERQPNVRQDENRSRSTGMNHIFQEKIASTFSRMACLCGWQAHREVVSTLQIIEVNESNSKENTRSPASRQNIRASALKLSLIGEGIRFLISSSFDQRIILWDLSGHQVGMFGQRVKWNLYDRTTWCKRNEDPTLGYIEPKMRTTTQEEDNLELIKRSEEEAKHVSLNMLNKGTTGNIKLSRSMRSVIKKRITAKSWSKPINPVKYGSSNQPIGGETLNPRIQFSIAKETERLPQWVPRRPKRESKLSVGWNNKIGRQTTDIWMRLRTSTVINVPKDRQKWMHQSHKRRIEKEEAENLEDD